MNLAETLNEHARFATDEEREAHELNIDAVRPGYPSTARPDETAPPTWP